MGLIQDDVGARLGDAARVAVVAAEGPEGILSAAVVALALEARERTPILVERGAPPGPVRPGGDSWAAALAEWYAEQDRPVAIVGWDGEAAIEADAVVVAGTPGILRASRPGCALVASVGTPEDAALAPLVANGGVLAVEAIQRFGTVGRHFVEMVEHVHHRVGPPAQSVAADTLRAALFGRHGRVPVNLATRRAPVAVGPASTLVWWIDPGELERIAR